MRTETINVYKFDELGEKAKQYAIQGYREHFTPFYEDVINDAKEIGSELGIVIDRVCFSGFGCQGDGASFIGSFDPKQVDIEAVVRHRAYAKALHDIAIILSKLDCEATITHQGRYQHSGCMIIDTDSELDYQSQYRPVGYEALRLFADCIYVKLEEEHEYQTSDEYITQELVGNDDEFYETGKVWEKIGDRCGR